MKQKVNINGLDIKIDKEIAEGGYATIFLCHCNNNYSQKYIIKKISLIVILKE